MGENQTGAKARSEMEIGGEGVVRFLHVGRVCALMGYDNALRFVVM